MFRTSLLTALLLSSAALAETPSDVVSARQQIRETFARVQSAVVKARDARDPVTLTCAANAEERLATLMETNSDAAQVAADEEAGMVQCMSLHGAVVAKAVALSATGANYSCYAADEEPLFRDPPEVSFNRPVR